ncbi:MAG TPA: aspartate aminotransferase family protein [Syntrophomonadaceae bacterium]|nr:aspartate aminotransferase family protein [Syntrophomonadaceae bacterium]
MTNQDIINNGQQYVMNTYGRFPIALVKGQGAYVWDANNKQYLDFVGGIAVCALGHSAPQLIEALEQQARTLWHVSNLYWIQPQVELARKLVQISGLGKAFFCNSGAEANEAAIKLARKYFFRKKEGGKNRIITFQDSFHGRTLATVTATGQTKYQEGFAPLPDGFDYAVYNDLASVEKTVNESTCAILVEPVQGEGGVRPADAAFLRGLRQICDREGILLIFDEVQCGLGRMGSFFAYQSFGVTPDMVTLAKGLGGGFPIGAMLASDEAASGFAPGDHASTFGGNPLATAVANRVVDIIGEPAFLEQVRQQGKKLMDELKKVADSRIVTLRGQGLLIGMEFNCPVKPLIDLCMNQGLLLVGAGPQVLRFVPPLNLQDKEIKQAVGILKQALREWPE